MPKYNKIDDGAKEAIMKVLKKNKKPLKGGLKEGLKEKKMVAGSEMKNILFEIEETLDKLGKKVDSDELEEIANFVINKMNIFKSVYNRDAELPLVVLYFYFNHLDDNTEQGYLERQAFVGIAKELHFLPHNFNVTTSENGLINEISFIDTYFPDKKEELLPGLSKLLSGDMSFDPIDFIIDGIPVEIKSLSYCSDKNRSKNPKPIYGIEESKLKKILKANSQHSVIVWAEQCSPEWRINNRNSSIDWKFIILSSDKFELISELDLYRQKYSSTANKTFEYFDTLIVKELLEPNQIFDVSSYDKYLLEKTKFMIDEDEQKYVDKINKETKN